MKQYLIDTFCYNDYANKLTLAQIKELPQQDECVRLFSHMINSMHKWLARVRQSPGYVELDWWDPVYPVDELEAKWDQCLKCWLNLLDEPEHDLDYDVEFIGVGGDDYTAEVKDIVLQLNYHAIHHRAQIQYLIRQQGVEPQFVDYIGTKYRKIC